MDSKQDKVAVQPVVIKSGRLEVEIARPGTAYSGTRFDWTAFITQVTLDGRHTFCVPESYEPGQGTGGAGLCNEFGIDMPIGYDDAAIGELFPKIGVGLLKKHSDTPYSFYGRYDLLPFAVEITAGDDHAIFRQEPVECRGYAFRLEKRVSVRENRVKIDYSLENTGHKEIHTSEYIHNFLGINGQPVGKNYCLSFPGEIQVDCTAGKIVAGNDFITWDARPGEDFYCRIYGNSGEKAFKWQLLHIPDGVGVREAGSYPTAKIAVWGGSHVVSPEMFVAVDLKPAERMEWTREYEFFAGL